MKATIQQRLASDLGRRAIDEGPTAWRDDRGSLVGSLLRSADLADGPSALGIPADVLALLDYIGGHIYFGWIPTSTFAMSAVEAIQPGADLTTVAATLVEQLAGEISDVGVSAGRSDDILELKAMLDAKPTSPEELTGYIDQWLHVRSREAVRASGWTDEQETAAQETLSRLWDETAEARDWGEDVNYPLLFEEVDPPLAMGYVNALSVSNRSYEADTTLVARWFVDALRAA